MNLHVIPLDPPLAEEFRHELSRRIYFLAEEITDFTIDGSDGLLTQLRVSTSATTSAEELHRRLHTVIANDILHQRVGPARVVWRSSQLAPQEMPDFDRLCAEGVVVPMGEGQMALAEPLISLLDTIDQHLVTMVREETSATQYRYPTLLRTETLRRCGYLSSFPHHLMFVTRLHGDSDTYAEFSNRAAAGDSANDLLALCGNTDYCLPPTMCYHTFQQLTDSQLAEPAAVTARGKSFRHESRYHEGLARLWDFTIREMVFLGSRHYAHDARERIMTRACELVEDWGLEGRCEVASDPFFAGAATAARISSQRLLELKFELQLPIAGGQRIACASFNFHDQHFGDGFRITGPQGSSVHSACAGFGLERLTLAIVSQHGTDPQAWPTALRPSGFR
jgi:seryl-tRNA synthetase